MFFSTSQSMGANNLFDVLSAVIAAPSNGKTYEQKDELPVDIKLPVKHVLSRELQVYNLLLVFCIIYFYIFHLFTWSIFFLFQLYFDKITELTVRKSDSALFKEALVSLATDSGLHPLVPYFSFFIADEVIIFGFKTIISI